MRKDKVIKSMKAKIESALENIPIPLDVIVEPTDKRDEAIVEILYKEPIHKCFIQKKIEELKNESHTN